MPPKKQKMPVPEEDDEMDMDMAEMMGGLGGLDMPMAKYMNPHYSEEFMGGLPEKIRQRAQVLLKYHDDYTKLQAEMEKKETALMVQFEKDTAYLFARRKEIISGTGAAVTDEEVKKGFPAEHEGKVGIEAASASADEKKGVPGFWSRALSNHLEVSSTIEEHDLDVLEHLVDVACRTLEEGSYGSQAVDFHFGPNDYFENDTLTLSMIGGEDGFEITRTAINWKPGKNVTVERVQKKQKARGSGATRTVTREVPRESFFNIFKEDDKDEDDEADEEDEEEEDADQRAISLIQVLFNNVVPNAVRHYTGEAPDGSSDLDEEDEEEEDEEEDSDDEDEMAAMMAMRGRGGGRGGARGGRGGRGF